MAQTTQSLADKNVHSDLMTLYILMKVEAAHSQY